MKASHVATTVCLAAIAFAAGYQGRDFFPNKNTASTQPKVIVNNKIVGQGRILPKSGLIQVFAPPGQRIVTILNEGSQVVEGATELATFTGQSTLKLQSDMADSQSDDANRELDQKLLVAEGNLSAASKAFEGARLQLRIANDAVQLQVLEKQLELAKQKLRRLELLEKDPQTNLFVSLSSLEEGRFQIEQAESQIEAAKKQKEAAIQAAELQVQSAQHAVEQAHKGVETLKALKAENRTVVLAKKIAEEQIQNAKLLSPITGTVLKTFGKPGEVMVNSPLMQLGDLSEMICQGEVLDRLAPQVQIGQSVTLTSNALPHPLRGKIVSVGQMVGIGMLAPPSPLAMADRKTIEVKVQIDAKETEIAQRLVNLQVTMDIELDPPKSSDPESSDQASTQSDPPAIDTTKN